MVRQLLGNIRGPRGERGLQGTQGPQGPKGDDGGFNGETIGVHNLLDFSKMKPNTGTVDMNYETGMLYFNDVGNIAIDLTLEPKLYHFKLSGLEGPEYGSNTIILRFEDSDKNRLYNVNTNVQKREIDLRGRSTEKYTISFYLSNTVVSGYLEKPMLVEGQHPAMWNPPTTGTQSYIRGWLRGEVTGTQSEPNKVRLAILDNTHDLNVTDNEIELTGGTWVVNYNANFNPIDNYDTYVHSLINLNDEDIIMFSLRSNQDKAINGSFTFQCANNDKFSIKTYKQSGGEEISFGGTISNQFSLYKLGV